jgi:hypothetical protein
MVAGREELDTVVSKTETRHIGAKDSPQRRDSFWERHRAGGNYPGWLE